MTSTDLKDRFALLKATVADIDELLSQDEAHKAVLDVFSIAAPREATFRFAFPGPVTTTGLRTLLAAISKRHGVDPGYVMVSWQDYEALRINEKSLVIIRLNNDYTGGSARVIVSPDIPPGEVIFGVLYAPSVASVVDSDAPRSIAEALS